MPTGKVVVPQSAENEYKKNSNITPEEIDKLRQWLEKQPHLPQNISELQLILVYHSCNCSAELSKKTLDLHFTLKTLFKNLFQNREADRRIEHVCNNCILAPLPVANKAGHRAIYCTVQDNDPRNFMFADSVRACMMVLELWQLEEGTWPGFIILIDMKNVVPGHLARLDITTIKQTLYFLQEAMLVRLKGVHFLNAPSFMDKLMMLLKPFMKKELMEMLSIHQIGSSTLEDHYPMKALPSDAGGEYKNFATLSEEQWQHLKANNEWFKEESKLRVDGTKRPGKQPDFSDLCGMQGSFKKLELD